MSTLRDYLERNQLRQADFGAQIGATQGMVSRLASGAILPGLELAVRIERATNGAVPASSWVPADSITTPTAEGVAQSGTNDEVAA